MLDTIIAQAPTETQEPVSATVLRLRWEAARRQHDKMLLAYSTNRCSAATLETFEQAEDRAYQAWQKALVA